MKYEAGKSGTTKVEVKSLVKSVGNSRKKVEERLEKSSWMPLAWLGA